MRLDKFQDIFRLAKNRTVLLSTYKMQPNGNILILNLSSVFTLLNHLNARAGTGFILGPHYKSPQSLGPIFKQAQQGPKLSKVAQSWFLCCTKDNPEPKSLVFLSHSRTRARNPKLSEALSPKKCWARSSSTQSGSFAPEKFLNDVRQA